MRIALLDSSDTLYPLAGTAGVSEREHSSAAGFELTAESIRQMQALLRATHAREIDRGNLLRRISFTTTRLFDTHAAASLWALAYDNDVPRTGTLVIENLDAGVVQSTIRIADATVYPPTRSLQGCTLNLSYTATGGALTVYEGTPPVYWQDIARNWEEL